MIREQQGDAVVNVCIIEMIIIEQVKLEGLSEVMGFRLDLICLGCAGLCQVALNLSKDGEPIPCLAVCSCI